MSPSRRLTLLTLLLTLALGGCAALNEPGQDVYVGGDAGAHKEIR